MRIDYIGYALAIISLVYAYYLYRKSIKVKEPIYSIRSLTIISDYTSIFTGLAVSYRGRPVKNFTLSKVLFFNRGARMIDGSDIASRNPLRIVAEDCNILEATVLQANNTSNGITLKPDDAPGVLRIEFEYLNHNDGAVLSILHDGDGRSKLDIVGDMKDARSPRRVAPDRMMMQTSSSRVAIGLWAAIAFFAVIYTLTGLLLPVPEALRGWFWGGLFLISALIVVEIIVLATFYLLRKSRVAIPRGLEFFFDE